MPQGGSHRPTEDPGWGADPSSHSGPSLSHFLGQDNTAWSCFRRFQLVHRCLQPGTVSPCGADRHNSMWLIAIRGIMSHAKGALESGFIAPGCPWLWDADLSHFVYVRYPGSPLKCWPIWGCHSLCPLAKKPNQLTAPSLLNFYQLLTLIRYFLLSFLGEYLSDKTFGNSFPRMSKQTRTHYTVIIML